LCPSVSIRRRVAGFDGIGGLVSRGLVRSERCRQRLEGTTVAGARGRECRVNVHEGNTDPGKCCGRAPGVRRRTKIVPHAVGERPVLKLMYAAVIRTADRWRSLTVSEFEQRQLKAGASAARDGPARAGRTSGRQRPTRLTVWSACSYSQSR
jgi:hypothetical protein